MVVLQDFLEQALFVFFLRYHNVSHDKDKTNLQILLLCLTFFDQVEHNLSEYKHLLKQAIQDFEPCLHQKV